jgi:hypothetical protein
MIKKERKLKLCLIPTWHSSSIAEIVYIFYTSGLQTVKQLSPYSDWLRPGRSGFDSRRELEIFLFTTVSIPALGPTQPPILWVSEALSLKVKRRGRETDHSPPSRAGGGGSKNAWSYTSTPPMPSWRDAQLKHRDNFTFTFKLFYVMCSFFF